MIFLILENIANKFDLNSFTLNSTLLTLPLIWLVFNKKTRKTGVTKRKKSLIQFFLIFGFMLMAGGVGVLLTDKGGSSTTIVLAPNGTKIFALTLLILGFISLTIGLTILFLENKKQKNIPPQ